VSSNKENIIVQEPDHVCLAEISNGQITIRKELRYKINFDTIMFMGTKFFIADIEGTFLKGVFRVDSGELLCQF
jgi:hypothetical protein